MRLGHDITVDDDALARFCEAHHIRRLAAFGSVTGDRFRPDSDIDLLVEFLPGHVPGLLGLASMELELSRLFGGHEVEMRTMADLSPYFRDHVASVAVPLHDAA